MDTILRKKLIWHCRRGTRELDYMTQYYLEHHYDDADVAHQNAFQEMLKLPDPQLHATLLGKMSNVDPVVKEIASLIREYCRN